MKRTQKSNNANCLINNEPFRPEDKSSVFERTMSTATHTRSRNKGTKQKPVTPQFISSIIVILFLTLSSALAYSQTTTRVSIDTYGNQGNGNSRLPSLSSDGRLVAFMSYATNLVDGDTNNHRDIFVHDRVTGETSRVSVDTAGDQGNGESGFAVISSDGVYVAFHSEAENLVLDDGNGFQDVFVHNRITGETARISIKYGGGDANQRSNYPDISSNGRYVAFDSSATNLVSADTNNKRDVFIHNQQTKQTELVSVNSDEIQGNGNSFGAAISENGRFVAFQSYATNLTPGGTNGSSHIFLRDRVMGETIIVSVDSDGIQGNGNSHWPDVSAEGRHITYYSHATNLVPEDTNGAMDIFSYDCVTGQTTRISVNSLGNEGNGDSSYPTISDNGRYIGFQSLADNLVGGDNNNYKDSFMHDRVTGKTGRVSVNITGEEGNNVSSSLIMGPNGLVGAFESGASNLVRNDTNGSVDIMVATMPPGISITPVQWVANGHYYDLIMPEDNSQGWSWNEAKDFAESMIYKGLRGHLVTVTSPEENQFLRDNFQDGLTLDTHPTDGALGTVAWIGLTDAPDEGVFKWGTGEPLTYTNWSRGEPNDGGPSGDEDFVFYWRRTWTDPPDPDDPEAWSWNDEYGFPTKFPQYGFFVEFEPLVTIIDLGTLGGILSKASDVNNAGQIVGYSLNAQGLPRGFLWTAETGMIDLGAWLDYASYAIAVNEQGQVIGMSYTFEGPHAFIWDAGTGMVDLGTLGGSTSEAIALNDLGQVVGDSRTAGDETHAFIWDTETGMIDLETLGGNESHAFAINNLGQVVGNSLTAEGERHAFLWTPSNEMMDLGTLGGENSNAYATNDLGQITGCGDTASGDWHAFMWSPDSGMVDLGTLGGNKSSGIDINDSSQIAGDSTGYGGWHHAFIWTPETGMADLGTLGGPSGYSISAAINVLGQVVGLTNLTPSDLGQMEAFIWTPLNGMMHLSSLGGDHGIPHALNEVNNGLLQAVGESRRTVSGEPHAVLWELFINPSSPEAEIDEITETVELLIGEGALSSGAGNALIAKLDVVGQKMAEENLKAACNVLQAFINQVNALVKSGRLSQNEGDNLILMASSISVCS